MFTSEAERLLKGSGRLPVALRRVDLAVLDVRDGAEGQDAEAQQPEDIDLPAFLAADLPKDVASMTAGSSLRQPKNRRPDKCASCWISAAARNRRIRPSP